MRAQACVVAEADGRGGTRLAVLRGESPLLLRRTGPRDADGVTVHLVGGAAGPLRGDELRLDIEVGPGARLEMLSVAASLALPGRPAPASRMTVTASVAAGGVLRWLPEPLIAAAGCDHVVVTRVEVADGGTLLWRDDLVCGRHAEASGAVRADTTVRYGGVTLYRHELTVGPRAPGWDGAAVLGGGQATGTVVMAGADLPEPAVLGVDAGDGGAGRAAGGARDGRTVGAGVDAALMRLAGPGVVATAVGVDIRQVKAVLDPLCGAGARSRLAV
ncbi:urease accessory protein UreD [Actinoplanes derwentensis]|uniref:Urease accessory protein UreD n=1 Tax=Actinoplanes derwentensis TaxID=113562 RepID=A0A1H2D9V3_9ACTN|nr:urease accessory protein UreD [Actinoplanes derwentensis]GID81658.1 urease accessory protein UreD [Actinoplanes derwentensis]SDT79538.1 urease accessory protein [Actinoplanes derwentensis]